MRHDNTTTKWCYNCDTAKPFSDFYRHRGRPDGLSCLCKSCSSEACRIGHKRRRLQYEELFARLYPDALVPQPESSTSKICSRCLLDKPLDLFYKDERYRFGRAAWCKNCRRLYSREYGQIQSRSEGPLPPLKLCTRCKERKPPEDFHLQASKKDGLRSHCKACRTLNESPLRVGAPARRQHLKAQYGLTPEGYMRMLANQFNQCAICGSPFEGLRIEVDHCHDTGKVRGLLCSVCNRWLAALEHATFIDKARQYLRNPPGPA